MAWKKRRRPVISALSFLYLSCGFIFLTGNVYILHSGFIQKYDGVRDRENVQAKNVQLSNQPNGGKETEVEADILVGLPSISFSTNNLDVSGIQSQFSNLNVESEIYGKKGVADAPLRKLMENRRESSADSAKYDTKSAQNIHTEYKTDVSLDRADDNALYYKPHLSPSSNVGSKNVKWGLYDESHSSPDVSSKLQTSKRTMSISAAELRKLLGRGSRCDHIEKLTDRWYISSGWTKAVYRAAGGPRRRPVAVKLVDVGGHDMAACREWRGLSPQACYAKASQKMLREMVLLQALRHPNIIQMMAYCVPQKPYDGETDSLVAMTTELGETIDIIKLLQMSWEDRLRISYGITRLLKYLAQSPFGTVALNDFRRQQFVLVNGDIKLTDVDDVGLDEPVCTSQADCNQFFSSANFTLRTPCVEGRCQGFNEKKNVFNAARHFTTFLLPHGAPFNLRPDIDDIVVAYSNATLPAGQLLRMLDAVVDRYRNGDYLYRRPEDKNARYTTYSSSDLPGQHDYRCRYSIAAAGCTLSVFDQREAEQLCDLDPDCKAFVMSNQRTWTGRIIVFLKNGVSDPSPNSNTTLCVKPAPAH